MPRRFQQHLAVAALLVVALVAGAAAAGLLAGFLPSSNSISGWVIIEGTDRGGSTDEVLYTLYDGAVPKMRQEGLVAAHQRVYKKGDKRLTADILQFPSWQKAKAYYVQRRNSMQKCDVFVKYSNIKQEAFVAQQAGTVSGMGWQRNFVFKCNMQGSGSGDRATVKRFLTYISNKIKAKYARRN